MRKHITADQLRIGDVILERNSGGRVFSRIEVKRIELCKSDRANLHINGSKCYSVLPLLEIKAR